MYQGFLLKQSVMSIVLILGVSVVLPGLVPAFAAVDVSPSNLTVTTPLPCGQAIPEISYTLKNNGDTPLDTACVQMHCYLFQNNDFSGAQMELSPIDDSFPTWAPGADVTASHPNTLQIPASACGKSYHWFVMEFRFCDGSPYVDENGNNNWIAVPITLSGITVTSPRGGEYWKQGAAYDITWATSGSTGSTVRINYYHGDVLAGSIIESTPNDGAFHWVIPADWPCGSDYKIGVQVNDNPGILDISDAVSSVIAGTVAITVPAPPARAPAPPAPPAAACKQS